MSDKPDSARGVEHRGLITKRFQGERYRVAVTGCGLIDASVHEKLRGLEPRIGVGDAVRVVMADPPKSLACIVHHESSASGNMLVFTDSSSLS